MPNSLGVIAGIEGSLENPSRKDDPVLGGQVIGIDSLWGHAPPGAGRWDRERGQAGVRLLSPQPQHLPVPLPTTEPCPGLTLLPPSCYQGTLSWGQATATTGDLCYHR